MTESGGTLTAYTTQELAPLRDVDALLLDLDNTLQMGDKLELRARLGHVAISLGMNFTEEQIIDFGDRSDFIEMRQLMVGEHNRLNPAHPLREEEFQAQNNTVSGMFDDRFYPADSVREFLENAKAAKKALAVVTTRGPVSINRRLEVLGIAGYMDYVVHRGTCPERKPHPAPLQRALLELEIDDPSNAAIVGDKQEDDVQGGINAGTLTVLVNKVIVPNLAQPNYHFTSLQPLAELYAPELKTTA